MTSLSNDVVQNYDTLDGRNAISVPISRGNITDEGPVITQNDLDRLYSKFQQFEETQAKILKEITIVEQTFPELLTRFTLLDSHVQLFTLDRYLRKYARPGNKNCWKTGFFTDREIKNGYDARRPITDTIIESIETNPGTVVYGDPYTGKSILLKRILFELLQRDYVVLFGDGVDARDDKLQHS